MKRCTFCETELDDRSLRDGRCAACGLDLDWKDSESDERDTHWVTAITGVANESSKSDVVESAKLRDSRRRRDPRPRAGRRSQSASA